MERIPFPLFWSHLFNRLPQRRHLDRQDRHRRALVFSLLTLARVYRQRFQWCLDPMRLFFWDNPLWKRGLTWAQKRHFLIIMLSYLASGVVFPIFYAIPLLVYLQGCSLLQGYELPYGALRLAYLTATVLIFRYLFYHQEPLKQFKILCSPFPKYALALGAALLYPPGVKPAYRVNNDLLATTFEGSGAGLEYSEEV
jgi:cellulose synthase (UDP-forming)